MDTYRYKGSLNQHSGDILWNGAPTSRQSNSNSVLDTGVGARHGGRETPLVGSSEHHHSAVHDHQNVNVDTDQRRHGSGALSHIKARLGKLASLGGTTRGGSSSSPFPAADADQTPAAGDTSNNHGCGPYTDCHTGLMACPPPSPRPHVVSCPTRPSTVKVLAKLLLFLLVLTAVTYSLYVIAAGWAHRHELLALLLLLLSTRLVCRKNWFLPTQYWRNLEPPGAVEPVELTVPTSSRLVQC